MRPRPEKGTLGLVGTNRRYADAVDARVNERALQSIAGSGKLQTLTPLELDPDRVP